MGYRDADYVTTAELKGFERVDDSVDDVQLALAVTAASRAIDRACGRSFGVDVVAVTREYRSGLPACDWAIDDLSSTTSLVVASSPNWVDDPVAVDAADYTLLPLNAAADGRPWERIELAATSGATRLQVTGLWGWSAVPDTIKQATLIQALRFVRRRDAPFGVAGSPELGSELRLLAQVDPDVELMLSGYKRRWAAV